VQDTVGGQYILSAAHVLALSPTGYYASGSNIPIVQPPMTIAYPSFISCPPTSLQIASITVGQLLTVLPLNLNDGVTLEDAALARAFSGVVTPQQYGISTFSNIPTGTNGHNIVHKGMLLQASGGFSGLRKGKVINAIAKSVRIKFCNHIETRKANCPYSYTIVQNTIEISGSLGQPGDSGSLVLTQDVCPQPVGIIISHSGAIDIAEELSPTLEALQSAGNYSNLSLASSGCAPSQSQFEANSKYDSDVLAAQTAIPSLQSWVTSNGTPYVMGIGVELSTDPARIE
jgi:hypothetical protein